MRNPKVEPGHIYIGKTNTNDIKVFIDAPDVTQARNLVHHVHTIAGDNSLFARPLSDFMLWEEALLLPEGTATTEMWQRVADVYNQCSPGEAVLNIDRLLGVLMTLRGASIWYGTPKFSQRIAVLKNGRVWKEHADDVWKRSKRELTWLQLVQENDGDDPKVFVEEVRHPKPARLYVDPSTVSATPPPPPDQRFPITLTEEQRQRIRGGPPPGRNLQISREEVEVSQANITAEVHEAYRRQQQRRNRGF